MVHGSCNRSRDGKGERTLEGQVRLCSHEHSKRPLVHAQTHTNKQICSVSLQLQIVLYTAIVYCLFVFRVFKDSDDVRLMRPASPESQSPDTNQGPARSVTPPTAAEPDTTQSGPSRETTEGLVTMMRCVCGFFC